MLIMGEALADDAECGVGPRPPALLEYASGDTVVAVDKGVSYCEESVSGDAISDGEIVWVVVTALPDS